MTKNHIPGKPPFATGTGSTRAPAASVRMDGMLTKWNDDRGFGFITPARDASEVFVHISMFPKDGQRPSLGERLSFEMETDKNGKKRAIKLVCLDRQARPAIRHYTAPQRSTGPSSFGRLALFAFVVTVIGYGYTQHSRGTPLAHATLPAVTAQPAVTSAPAAYQCDGRTHCSQMTSCAEATYFLKHCPGTEMDGDHDGIPCESHWCTN